MAEETRSDTADDSQAEDAQTDDAQSDRPKWLIDELQHYLPGVDITAMPDSDVAAALKKYVDRFHLGQYGDLIDDPGLKDILDKDAEKQGLGQYGDQIDDPNLAETLRREAERQRLGDYADRIDDPGLKDALEKEAERQRLGDFGDLVDDPGLKDALEKEAERQRLGGDEPGIATPTGGNSDDPMNPHNTQPGEPPRTKTPEQRMDERLENKFSDGRPSPGSGTSNGPSLAPSTGSTPGGSSGQSGATTGGGSPTDTQNLLGGTSSAAGSTTGTAGGSSVGGTSAAGAGAVGSSGSSGPPSGSTAHGAFPNGLDSPGELGYRDSDGNWYDENGSPMSSEMSQKMEEAYQNGETVDYDSASDGSEGGEAGDAGGDGADAAPDPPPDNDSEDIEYTAADDVGPRPGTPGFERFQELSADYIAIRNQARADSTINPVREGSNDATGEEVYDESKSLTGADGDERYDSAATSSSGGSSAGQGYGNSSGSGAITYGPDSDVDFGVGPEDEVPIIDGPPEDLSHLADSITGQHDETETAGSALPGGLSPSDLKIENSATANVEQAGIIRPVQSQPVGYMTMPGDPVSSSSANSDQEPSLVDVILDSGPSGHRPELLRDLPIDDEDDDSGQLAAKDIDIPTADLDPGHDLDPRGAAVDLRGISAFDVFEKPDVGSLVNTGVDSLPEVTEEGWYTIPEQPDSPFDDTRVTFDATENSSPVRDVPTNVDPIDFASGANALQTDAAGANDSRIEPLSFELDRAVEPLATMAPEVPDHSSPPAHETSIPGKTVADPVLPEGSNPIDLKIETGNQPDIEPTLLVDPSFTLKPAFDTGDEDEDLGE